MVVLKSHPLRLMFSTDRKFFLAVRLASLLGILVVKAKRKESSVSRSRDWVQTTWLRKRLRKLQYVFLQQRKLLGSSAQNSSGVHWWRRRVRFNEVPEKVPKVPEKVEEALVQSQVSSTGFRRRFWRRFRKVSEKVRRRSGRLWCRARSGSTRFRRRFRRRPGRLWCKARSRSTAFRRRFWRRSGRLWCRAGQVQQGSGEGSREGCGEGRGGFGAEPGQVQQGSGEGSGEGRGGFGAEAG